jgi:hypothetical protein
MPNRRKDYAGQRFGKLIAVRYFDTIKNRSHSYSRWLCKCDCGKEIVVASFRFSTESKIRTLSCGCENHGNRQYTPEESTFRVQYSYHAKSCNNNKWGALPYDDWKRLVTQTCVTCGSNGTERNAPSGATISINGIDRKDSAKGYTLDNVQTLCTWCNIAKGTLSTEGFIEKCKQVASRSIYVTNTTTKESVS